MIVPPKRKILKKRQKIHTWLRQRISPIDFGCKFLGHPIHSNSNARVLEAFNGGRWLSHLTNADMDEHFFGEHTYYFAGNGSKKSDETLANIDIDCHGGGSPAGAMAYANHLRSMPLFGDSLYVETSTHGEGAHSYIVVIKDGSSDRNVNAALKILEQYLKGIMILGNFDVTDIEVKGTCPEMTWGQERGRLDKYQSGQLAKLPREALHRADELMGTTRVHIDRLFDLALALANMAEAAGAPSSIVARIRLTSGPRTVRYPDGSRANPASEPLHRVNLEKLKEAVKALREWKATQVSEPGTILDTLPMVRVDAKEQWVQGNVTPKKVRGSTEAPTVSDEIAGRIRGKLIRFVKNWFDIDLRAGKGNRLVHADVIALLIAILAHTKDHPNKDGTTPTNWIKMLWEDLKERGYTKHPWDHHVYKAARDFLSRQGWLVWRDENYVIGREVNGEYQKGEAAKWEASDYLRSIASVDEEKVEEGSQGEERKKKHIYGHNTIRFNPDTIPDYLRDQVQYWKSPQFAGYLGQMRSQAA